MGSFDNDRHAGARIGSVFLRFFEFASAAIVMGILAYFINRVRDLDGPLNGRITYAEVVAVLGIVFSILLIFPAMFTFMLWPVDVLMFIMWLVAFALLCNLSLPTRCSLGGWYSSYWGFYWYRAVPVNTRACREWRTVIAFACISWFLWLASAIVGIYVFASHRDEKRANADRIPATNGASHKKHRFSWHKEKHSIDSNQARDGQDMAQHDGVTATEPRQAV